MRSKPAPRHHSANPGYLKKTTSQLKQKPSRKTLTPTSSGSRRGGGKLRSSEGTGQPTKAVSYRNPGITRRQTQHDPESKLEMKRMETATKLLYDTANAESEDGEFDTSRPKPTLADTSSDVKGRHGIRRCCYAWLVLAKRNPGVEIFLYICFFVVLLAFSQDVKGRTSTYFYASLVEDVIVFEEFPNSHVRKDFRDIAENSEFWDFVHGPFYSAIFGNHKDTCTSDNRFNDTDCSSRRGKLFYSDFALLDIRFKQNRVKRYELEDPNAPVSAPPRWIQKWAPDTYEAMKEQGVYPEYSFHDQDESTPFNLTGPIASKQVEECFEYKARKFDWTTTGKIYPLFYSPSGYSCFIPTNSSNFDIAQQWLIDLEESKWLDQGTRLILIDMTLYSQNIDTFLFFRVGVEQAPTGGLMPFWDSYTVMLPEKTPLYTVALRGLLMALCSIFFIQEISEWCHHGCSYYCSSFWNVLELVNLSMFFTYSIIMIIAEVILEHEKNTTNFDVFTVGLLRMSGDTFLSINMVFSVLKIFKYIKVSRRMQLMLNTFYDARWALFALLVLVVVFLVGFSMAFFIAFGHRIEGFRSFSKSFVTLFFSLLDGFAQAKDLERVNWFLGPLLYLSFQVFISFVLLSLLIAIIEDSFNTAQEELKNNNSEDALVVAMRNQVGKWWRGAKKVGKGVSKRAQYVPGVKMVSGRLSKLKSKSRSSKSMAGVVNALTVKERGMTKEKSMFLKKVIESGRDKGAVTASKRMRRNSSKFPIVEMPE